MAKEKRTPRPAPHPHPAFEEQVPLAKETKPAGNMDGLVMGRMVRYVLIPTTGGAQPRLGMVTRVIDQEAGLVDLIVYPHAGDFPAKSDPGLFVGMRDVPHHSASEDLVPGSWHWPAARREAEN